MAEQKEKSFWDELEENARKWWRQMQKKNAEPKSTDSFWSKAKNKGVAFFHKYIPSLMILFSGTSVASANTETSALNDYKPIEKTIVAKPKTNISINNLNFDVNKMTPEDISMIFMSNHKFNAIYAPKGKKPTMKNATGFGPLLTRIDDLKGFIKANPEKYAALKEVMDTKGINSNAFEKVWSETYNTQQKQQEIIKDLVQYSWAKDFQPTFNKLAKIGYPKITHDNYDKPENFGYTAAVISCLGQSKKQTADIFSEAKQRAEAALGDKASLNDFIDASYDIRHERWGLDVRYFGKNGNDGEKDFNKKVRNLLNTRTTRRISDAYLADINDAIKRDMVASSDAIKLPRNDSVFFETMKDMQEKSDVDSLPRLMQSKKENDVADNDIKLEEIIDPYNAKQMLVKLNLLGEGQEGLQSYREKLNTELSELKSKLEDISSDIYSIMSRKLNVNYGRFMPEMVGHVYESALDPTMKDAANSALGLYQFNLNNTMKLLANDFADEFPRLKVIKDQYGVKSDKYAEVWREYSTGAQKERFEQRQLEFMWRIAYQPAFDKMTKSCGLPKITLENYNQKEYRVYAAAMMSLVNQSPRSSTKFMKQAYNRVARHLTNGKPEPNQVGLVSYDVRDEAWGKNKSLHRRYMGGKGVIGEKELCIRMMKYDEKAPQLMAQVEEKERIIAAVDFALNNPNQLKDLKNPFLQPQDIASNDAIKSRMDKIEAIQKHARNIKELRSLRRRVRHNLSKVVAGEEIASLSSTQKRFGDDDKYKRRGGRRRA